MIKSTKILLLGHFPIISVILLFCAVTAEFDGAESSRVLWGLFCKYLKTIYRNFAVETAAIYSIDSENFSPEFGIHYARRNVIKEKMRTTKANTKSSRDGKTTETHKDRI